MAATSQSGNPCESLGWGDIYIHLCSCEAPLISLVKYSFNATIYGTQLPRGDFESSVDPVLDQLFNIFLELTKTPLGTDEFNNHFSYPGFPFSSDGTMERYSAFLTHIEKEIQRHLLMLIEPIVSTQKDAFSNHENTIDNINVCFDELTNRLIRQSKGDEAGEKKEYVFLSSLRKAIENAINYSFKEYTVLISGALNRYLDKANFWADKLQSAEGACIDSTNTINSARIELEKARAEAKDLLTHTITIVGIFIAGFVSIFGVLNIIEAVLTFSSLGTVDVICYGLILAIALLDVIFLLLFTISRVSDRDIGIRCKNSDCSDSNDCAKCNQKCSNFIKLRNRYPYMYYSNIIAVSLICINGLYTFAYQLLFPTIKAMYRSFFTSNLLVLIIITALMILSIVGCIAYVNRQNSGFTFPFKSSTVIIITILFCLFMVVLLIVGISYMNQQYLIANTLVASSSSASTSMPS